MKKIVVIFILSIFKVIIISGSVMVLLGVIKMYLSGEVALSIEKKRKDKKLKKENKELENKTNDEQPKEVDKENTVQEKN